MGEAKKKTAGESFSGKFLIRMSPELHARVAELAERNTRSVNGEIQHALEGYVRAETGRKR